MSPRSATAAVLLLASLMLTACSPGEPDTKETATAIDFHTSPNYAEDMSSCLRDEGWDVTAHGDGSYSASIPAEQQDAYDAARGACEKEFGYDETIDHAPFTEAELRLLYQLELVTANCLTDHGHDVGDIPSEQLFVDSYYDSAIETWYAYRNVWKPGTALSQEEYDELLKACPRPSDEGHPGTTT